MDEHHKVLAWSSDGKRGIELDEAKYHLVRDFILEELKKKKEVTLPELLEEAKNALHDRLHAEEVSFLLIKVKGDLEARQVISKKWTLRHTQVLKIRKQGVDHFHDDI